MFKWIVRTVNTDKRTGESITHTSLCDTRALARQHKKAVKDASVAVKESFDVTVTLHKVNVTINDHVCVYVINQEVVY